MCRARGSVGVGLPETLLVLLSKIFAMAQVLFVDLVNQADHSIPLIASLLPVVQVRQLESPLLSKSLWQEVPTLLIGYPIDCSKSKLKQERRIGRIGLTIRTFSNLINRGEKIFLKYKSIRI